MRGVDLCSVEVSLQGNALLVDRKRLIWELSALFSQIDKAIAMNEYSLTLFSNLSLCADDADGFQKEIAS